MKLREHICAVIMNYNRFVMQKGLIAVSVISRSEKDSQKNFKCMFGSSLTRLNVCQWAGI